MMINKGSASIGMNELLAYEWMDQKARAVLFNDKHAMIPFRPFERSVR
jgi:hypothetical protein